MAARFTPTSYLLRLLLSLILVLATYNPSGHSWIHWFMEAQTKTEPFLLLAGITLLIGWTIFLGATFRSLEMLGIILGAALLGAILWVFISYGILTLDKPSAVGWVVLIMVALLLSIGISWSHIKRRLTGQLDVDDVEEE